MRRAIRHAIALTSLFGACAFGQQVFRFTFDDVESLDRCPGRFEKGVSLESPGFKGSKGCIARSADGIYAQINFHLPEPVAIAKGAKMRFAHRVATEGEAKYVGIFFFCVGGERVGQGGVPTGPEWQVSETEIVGLGPTGFAKYRGKLEVGDRIERIQLYGRLADKAFQTTYIDDWELIVPGAAAIKAKAAPAKVAPKANPGDDLPPPKDGELFSYDFESGRREDYAAFREGGPAAPGFQSKHAWTLSGNAKFLNLNLDCDFVLRPGLMLWLDTKVITGRQPLYVGIYLHRADGQKMLISNVPSSTEWEEGTSRKLEYFGPDQKSKIRERGKFGERYTRITFYSKVDQKGEQTLMVDNVRLVWQDGVPPAKATVLGKCFVTSAAKRIDGVLADWRDVPGAAAMVIGEAEHAHMSHWYMGTRDLSAAVYASHDEANLYLAYVVSDDVVRSSWAKGNQIHQGDCVLAAFAPTFPAQSKQYRRVYMFSPGDRSKVKPVRHLSVGPADTKSEFAVGDRKGGYVVEVRIPKAELGFEIEPGGAIGFDTFVYDSDERFGASSRKAIFAWASRKNRYSATECGRLDVVAAAAAKVDRPAGAVEPGELVSSPVESVADLQVRTDTPLADAAGLPMGLSFSRGDLPRLRERIKTGPGAGAFEMLQILCNLYLENCRPHEWTLDKVDVDQAALIEKYVTRLSFIHLLSGDPRYAELARQAAMAAAGSKGWSPDDREVGPRLVATLVRAQDWLHHYLTPGERKALSDRVRGHEPQARAAAAHPDRCPEVAAIIADQVTQAGPSLDAKAMAALAAVKPRLRPVPFNHDAPSPMRPELVGTHPRTLFTAQLSALVRAKAAAIPDSIWKPGSIRPRIPPPPARAGNSGGPAHWLHGIAMSYWATGQDVYLEQGKMVMRRICEYRRWGGHNHLPADVDLDAAACLLGIGVGYDLLYHGMMPSERKFVRDKLVRHARKMYGHWSRRDAYSWDQNHTYIDCGGLWVTAIALYDEVPEAKEWYDFGAKVIKKGLYCCNAPDGGFYEGVAYWGYGGYHLLMFSHILENVTGENVFDWYEGFKNCKHFLAHTTLPGWKYQVNMWDAGDSTVYARRFDQHYRAMLLAASRYRDREAQGLAERFHERGKLRASDDAWTLLWWDPTVDAVDPLAPPGSRSRQASGVRPESWRARLPGWPPYHHFTDFDMVFLRSSWDDDAAFLGMRCGPPLGRRATEQVLLKNEIPDWRPGTGHVHPDINALLIYNRGEPLAVDTGYTQMKLARDHNTVVVDGGGQIGEGQVWPRYEPWDRYGRIGQFVAAPGCGYYLRGEAARAYKAELKLTQFDRHVWFVDRDYFVVFDELASEEPHQYEWLCHSIEPALKADGRFVVTQREQAMSIHMLLPGRPDVVQEDAVVSPTPWRPDATHRGKRLRLGVPGRPKAAQFLTVLSLHRADEAPPTVGLIQEGEALGARVVRPDWSDVVLVKGQAAGIATDAERSFVRVGKERDPLRWMMVSGRELRVGGRALAKADVATSCAWRLVAGQDGRAQTLQGRVAASQATVLQVHVPRAPRGVTIDAAPVLIEYHPGDAAVRLALPAGEHSVAIGF